MLYLSTHVKDIVVQIKILTGRDFYRSLGEFADRPGVRITHHHRTEALITIAPPGLTLAEESRIIPRNSVSEIGDVEAECLVAFSCKKDPKEIPLPWKVYSMETNRLRQYVRKYIRELHRLAF